MSENRFNGWQGESGQAAGAAEDASAATETGAGYGGSGAATGAALAPATGFSARAREYRQSVAGAASTAREYLSDKAFTVSDRFQELSVTRGAKSYTRQNPAQALLVSAAAGFFLGLLLPGGRRPSAAPEGGGRAALSPQEGAAYAPARVTPLAHLMPSREYLVSKPLGYSPSSGRFDAQLGNLNAVPDLRILDEGDEDGDNKLLLLSDVELAGLRASVPGLVIEPNIFYKFGVHALLEYFNALRPPARSKTVTVRVVDATDGRPLPGVPVYLVTGSYKGWYSGYRGITGRNGVCRIAVAQSRTTFESLIVDPEVGYWTKRLPRVAPGSSLTVALSPLLCNSAPQYDWGHVFAGMNDALPQKGEGVTIGIIDSGVSADHPALSLAGGRNCVRRENPALWHEDASGHGTHCAGVVAATMTRGRGVKGYAPRARIFAYKAVPKGAPGPIGDAIIRAVKRAVKDGCDIISMSFGSSRSDAQTVLLKELMKAYERGVFCVAAAGNEAGEVNYPAAFPLVMGVGAFGKLGVYPRDSLHAEFESRRRSRDGNYYLANFSNRGRNLDFCAPGVAVVSTVPGGGYLAKDGTSMACPQVVGIAALALAAHPEVMNAKRDGARVDDLVHILKSRSEPLGFGPRYEGAGGLKVTSLLGA